MISIKSNRELNLMREAGRIVGITHSVLKDYIKPGISTLELDTIAYNTIIKYKGIPSFKGYGGFPKSICTSINDTLIHGIPDNTILKDGDIISIDIGVNYQGYHGDSAWTYPVGNVDSKILEFLKVCEESLYIGLNQVKSNNRIGDISNSIQTYIEDKGYSIPKDYTGHGIGNELHEEPYVPNIGKANTLELLKEHMTLAIEPMIIMGKPHTIVLDDNWTVKSLDKSLTAHYEHTIVVKVDGYEILTKKEG